MTDPSRRLIRFRLKLEDFDFTAEHVPGKQNAKADALSRKDNAALAIAADERQVVDAIKVRLQEDHESCLMVTTTARAAPRRLFPATIDNETEGARHL